MIKLLTNNYMLVILNIICIYLFTLSNSSRFFGKIINSIYPCKQNILNSFPCYGWVDIIIMFLVVVIFIITLSFIIFKILQFIKS